MTSSLFWYRLCFGTALAASSLLAAAQAASQPASQAASQPTPAAGGLQRLTGEVTAVAPERVSVRIGADQKDFALDPKITVVRSTPAALSDIKPGMYLGVESIAGTAGRLEATEVHIFADNMRGMGEGHRPAPGSKTSSMTNAVVAAVGARSTSMTNATVSKVGAGSAASLELSYSGGRQSVQLRPGTTVRHLAMADRSALKVGSRVVVFAAGDGTVARLVRVLEER